MQIAKIAYPDETADHDQKTDDRGQRRSASAPLRIHARLNDVHQAGPESDKESRISDQNQTRMNDKEKSLHGAFNALKLRLCIRRDGGDGGQHENDREDKSLERVGVIPAISDEITDDQ